MERLWDWLVEWWNKPSPPWLQKASLWIVPSLLLIAAFAVGGLSALLHPYLGRRRGWGHLAPGDPDDTEIYAVIRTLIGGTLAVIALILWWRHINRSQEP